MTPLARYDAVEGVLASGSATARKLWDATGLRPAAGHLIEWRHTKSAFHGSPTRRLGLGGLVPDAGCRSSHIRSLLRIAILLGSIVTI